MRCRKVAFQPGEIAAKRRPLVVLFVFIAVTASAFPATAYEKLAGEEGKIVAAYVYNICKFVTWPTDTLDTLQIGVLGDEAALAKFQSLDGKMVGDSSLKVGGVEIPPVPQGLRVVYISAARKTQVENVLASLSGESVLTVSSCDKFCDKGGMVGLVNIRGKIRFEVNQTAAEAAGITINSQVLKMAIRVIR